MRMLPTTLAVGLALALPSAAFGQASAAIASGQTKPSALAPSEIVAAAPAKDWVAVAPSDLLVMTLAPDRDGKPRQVVIQLIPAPFSQGWVGNIRKLAAAHWWDGLSINRVQDNYVVQWGDGDAEDKAKAKALPSGLGKIPQDTYTAALGPLERRLIWSSSPAERNQYIRNDAEDVALEAQAVAAGETAGSPIRIPPDHIYRADAYRVGTGIWKGWALADDENRFYPIHCYGMVGVGRDLAPDTGSGAELYTVIGHAPRHLDRNIALVGRVVEGIEHLSSLPRGTLALGFYEKPEQRVAIRSIRLATELPKSEQPRFEYLSTESGSFAQYADARANRRDPFFNVPAGGADICNIPVPVRRVAAR